MTQRVVLVTGGSRGIGRASAIALARGGARVAINYREDKDGANETLTTIRDSGGDGLIVRADVANAEDVEAMFASIEESLGPVEILVANAGATRDKVLGLMQEEDWQFVLDVNLTGQFLCSREAIREFKRRGIRKEVSCAAGKIICMSSVHEVIPWAGHVNYAASKGGVTLMMKSIAQEVAPHRIRVNSVCPGAVRTPINMEAWGTPEAYRELMKLIPYKRIGEPDDIGRAAVWLASDDSDYIHGASIFVDGGMTLYPGFETGG